MWVGIDTLFSKPLHRAANAREPTVEDVGTDHRRLDVAMAKKRLYSANVAGPSRPVKPFVNIRA